VNAPAGIAAPADRTGVAVIATAALTALAVFGTHGQPLVVVAYVAALLVALALIAGVEHHELMIVLLVGAAALDVTGRIATIGPARITLYQGLFALVALLLVSRAAAGRLRLHATPIDVPLLAFVALMLLSMLVARDRAVAAVQTASFISSALLAYVIVYVATDIRKLRWVVIGTAAIAAAVGVLGVLEHLHIFTVGSYLQIWGRAIRAKVTFGDPNIMASFEATAIALTAPLVLVARRWPERLALAGLIGLASAGLYSTGSRGGMGAALIAVVVVVALSRLPKPLKGAFLLGGATLLVIGAALFFDVSWLESQILDNSALTRVYMGASSLQMAAENPLGVGAGNYPLVYPFFRNVAVRSTLVESHTAYLTILVETGVAGLVAFLAVLWRYAAGPLAVLRDRAADDELHALALGSIAAVVGMAAQAFTYSLETSKFWWLAIGIGIAAWAIGRRARDGVATPA